MKIKDIFGASDNPYLPNAIWITETLKASVPSALLYNRSIFAYDRNYSIPLTSLPIDKYRYFFSTCAAIEYLTTSKN